MVMVQFIELFIYRIVLSVGIGVIGIDKTTQQIVFINKLCL